MKYIGAHVDALPDLSVAPLAARELGATAFALNLTDPGRWKSPAIPDEVAKAFKDNCALAGITPNHILPHAGFVINLCSPESYKLKLSRTALADEMNRAKLLGLVMVNFHPGAHICKMTDDRALDLVAQSINDVLAKTEDVTAVIENTAGQGSNMGYSFAQLGKIIAGVEDKSRVGVCIDTAHAFAAGYSLADPAAYDEIWDAFDNEVGFAYLRGMHLNDSVRECGSRIDRHAPIGKGLIGEEFFAKLMRDPRFDNLPLILETPNPELWQAEVAWLLKQSLE